MLELDIGEFHPKGRKYEIHEDLDSVPLWIFEEWINFTSDEEAKIEDFLKKAYKIPKSQTKMIPMNKIRQLEECFVAIMSEANQVEEIKAKPISELPYYRYMDIETQVDQLKDHPAFPGPFIKYLVAIAEGDDYDVHKDPQIVEKRAKAVSKRSAGEVLRLYTFFLMTDPRFESFISQYTQPLDELLLPIQQVSENYSEKDGGGSWKLRELLSIGIFSSVSSEMTRELKTQDLYGTT